MGHRELTGNGGAYVQLHLRPWRWEIEGLYSFNSWGEISDPLTKVARKTIKPLASWDDYIISFQVLKPLQEKLTFTKGKKKIDSNERQELCSWPCTSPV